MVGDHPRTCGENQREGYQIVDVKGSPPHLRGKLYRYVDSRIHQRITPAPAGKTSRTVTITACNEDHPRTCGENYIRTTKRMKVRGSPPHLRGKPSNLTSYFFIFGITPAPAGKTKNVSIFRNDTRDHPRTCGENHFYQHIVYTDNGSPPHLRGKH